MTTRYTWVLFSLACLLAAETRAMVAAAACEREPAAYTATYSLTRNDKQAGEMQVLLRRTGADTFIYRLQTDVKRGILKAHIEQQSAFTFGGGRIRPDHFYSIQKMALYKKQESVDFDWPSLTASGKKKLRKFELTMPPDAQDKLTVNLGLASALCTGAASFDAQVVSGPELKDYHYVFQAEETLDTVLGQLGTIHVRMGSSESDKQTDSWHAGETRFLPVKIVYRKGNNVNILRLTRIVFEDSDPERRTD